MNFSTALTASLFNLGGLEATQTAKLYNSCVSTGHDRSSRNSVIPTNLDSFDLAAFDLFIKCDPADAKYFSQFLDR